MVLRIDYKTGERQEISLADAASTIFWSGVGESIKDVRSRLEAGQMIMTESYLWLKGGEG